MKIKYIPCKWNEYAKIKAYPDTVIQIFDRNILVVDDETYEFDQESVEWQNIINQTNGVILEARRDGAGELWVIIRRFYTGDCSSWDTGDYHQMGVGDVS